jgi:uncharacterized membrane protein
MTDLLHQSFGWVCGQFPAHTWSPGGESLPLCQRCTGVYIGALVAALQHLAWRPTPTPGWLWLNGAFLLFIIPSGFYWIPQNPELRCASGVLFGFGLVAYLWLTRPEKSSRSSRVNKAQTKTGSGTPATNMTAPPHGGGYKLYACTLLATLVFTPVFAENGNAGAARLLASVCLAGALVLAALAMLNIFFGLRWLSRRLTTRMA